MESAGYEKAKPNSGSGSENHCAAAACTREICTAAAATIPKMVTRQRTIVSPPVSWRAVVLVRSLFPVSVSPRVVTKCRSFP